MRDAQLNVAIDELWRMVVYIDHLYVDNGVSELASSTSRSNFERISSLMFSIEGLLQVDGSRFGVQLEDAFIAGNTVTVVVDVIILRQEESNFFSVVGRFQILGQS